MSSFDAKAKDWEVVIFSADKDIMQLIGDGVTMIDALHQKVYTREEVIKKMNRYSSLGVPKIAHKRVTMAGALGHGIWSFIKHYIFKRGFVDGEPYVPTNRLWCKLC